MGAVRSLLLSFLFSLPVWAVTPVEEKARFVCDSIFNSGTFIYEDHFDSQFVGKISKDAFLATVTEVLEVSGKCTHLKTVAVSDSGKGGIFTLLSTEGNLTTISLMVEAGRIAALMISDVEFAPPLYASWQAFSQKLDELTGHVALSLIPFGGAAQEIRGTERHPLGSEFKLYVLGALADQIAQGKAKWKDTLAITDAWKSLPSGNMHLNSQGTPYTLQEYAQNMIQISDNTATDHLIHFLGRETVEAQLPIMNNDFIPDNTPFLMTNELFKLKWGVPETIQKAYLKASSSERRKLLDGHLASVPLASVGSNGVKDSAPVYVREMEWFASTHAICEGLKILKDKKSPEVLDALSRNIPFVNVGATHPWKYAGFKGGSEPGVLTLSYLLQTQKNTWGCVSFAWYDETKLLNNFMAYALVRKALALAQKHF